MDKITAIYIRVSTDFQAEEGYSIDAQKEQLSAMCVAKQWTNSEFYIDGGWSGSNIDRPEIQRLIKDCKKKKIERVLVYKLDRLSRSQKDTLYLIEDVFNANNVDFVSLTESLDTSTAMGKLMIGILAAFAQLERENIRMRTRMGMKERVKNGYWMGGGRTPFGYDYDMLQGILVPNPIQADIVRQIYTLYIEGNSLQSIADMFGIKRDKSVSDLLTRKCNYGMIEYNGEVYQGRHEPLISKETYDKAMTIMDIRSNSYTRNHTGYLLTGLLVCGHCGAKMRYQKWSGGKSMIYCYSHQKSKKYLIKDPNCPQPRIDSKKLEEDVLNAIFQLKENNSRFNDTNDAIVSKEDALIKQQNELVKKIKRLYNLYSQAEDDLLIDEINSNRQKLKKIEKEIQICNKEKNSSKTAESMVGSIDTLGDRWKYLSLKEQQQVCKILIKSIVVKDDDIEINLNI